LDVFVVDGWPEKVGVMFAVTYDLFAFNSIGLHDKIFSIGI